MIFVVASLVVLVYATPPAMLCVATGVSHEIVVGKLVFTAKFADVPLQIVADFTGTVSEGLAPTATLIALVVEQPALLVTTV